MRNIAVMSNVCMHSSTYYLIKNVPITSERTLQLTVVDATTEKCILLHSRNTCLCLLFYYPFCYPEERV